MAAASDTELMTAVRDGDLSQLGPLFERHHVGLFNFLLRLTGNRAGSEDLVQEVFVRILKYRKSFRPTADFRPWLYALARNAAAADYRKHRRDPGQSSPAPVGATGAAGVLGALAAPGARAAVNAELEETLYDRPVALEQLEAAEAARLLRSSLLRLPYDKREVLLLSRFGEMPYEQIAGLLGCTVGAVKLRVHRAVKRLREIYDETAGSRRDAGPAQGAATP